MITILYCYIVSKAFNAPSDISVYHEHSRRFFDSYKQFKPSIDHELLVVRCGHVDSGAPMTNELKAMSEGTNARYTEYLGRGKDCGIFQSVGRNLSSDWVLGLSTSAYFKRIGWLERFQQASKKYGPGVYGATGSFEIRPHLRTTCLMFTPRLMSEYPNEITSPEKASAFEAHGDWCFSGWVERRGFSAMLVTVDGQYSRYEWNKPNNVFRKGDQSNLLVYDKNTDVFDAASEEERNNLTKSSYGV